MGEARILLRDAAGLTATAPAEVEFRVPVFCQRLNVVSQIGRQAL
jgi:hypothetical protein